MTLFGAVNSTKTLDRQQIIGVDNFRVGGTAPTSVTIGTTPATPALLFDATAEIASYGLLMPVDWDNGNFNLVMDWAISDTAVVASATLDVTVDYIATDSTNHTSLTKTSTQSTGIRSP